MWKSGTLTKDSKVGSLVAGILVLLVGMVVLIGWSIDSMPLKTVFPGFVTMKANTALGLLLSGGALALLSLGSKNTISRLCVSLAATLICGLGMVTLCEYFFNWNAGIDQLLFHDVDSSIDTARPGLMAPSTAFCFVMLGTAFGIASRRKPGLLDFSLLSALAATIVGIGGVAGLGQISNALFHFHVWNYFWMAVHTSITFFILGVGLLLYARSSGGLTWALDKATSLGFAGAILGMLAAANISWSYASDLKDATTWVSHSQEVLKEIENLRASLAVLQTRLWAYVIYGDETLVTAREKTKQEFQDCMLNLRKLTADNPEQITSLDKLNPLVVQRTAFGDQAIVIRRKQGLLAAQKWLTDGRNIALSREIEKDVEDLRTHEYALLVIRQKRTELVSSSTFLLQPLCIFLSLTVLSLALFILNAGIYERKLSGETTARLAAIVNSSSDAIIGVDLHGIIISWNRGAETIFGYSAVEIIGNSIIRLIPPDRQRDELDIMGRIKNGHCIEHLETLRVTKSGELVDIAVTISPIKDQAGRIVGASKIARDITQNKRIREALHQSEDQFRTMANALPQLAWMAKADGFIYWYNHRWFEYTGTEPEQMEGWGWQSVHHPDSLPKVMEAWKRSIAKGERFEMEFPLKAADGRYGWFLTIGLPLKDETGRIVRWLGTNTDLSQKREAEEEIRKLNSNLELRVAERTSELENANKELEAFSYSVSHDLRAPLRAIDGFAQAVIEDYGDKLPNEGLRYLKTIRGGSQRMGVLIDDLLAFSQLNRIPLIELEIRTKEHVENILEAFKKEINSRGVEVRIGNLPDCMGAPSLLEQVWVNLISNALKYSRQREKPVIEIGCNSEKSEHVFFVRDNGVGFDMRYSNKLFGVFQRLHRQEEFDGTGVGLAIVQRILHRHGDRIWVEAAPDRGATFYFTLKSKTIL